MFHLHRQQEGRQPCAMLQLPLAANRAPPQRGRARARRWRSADLRPPLGAPPCTCCRQHPCLCASLLEHELLAMFTASLASVWRCSGD